MPRKTTEMRINVYPYHNVNPFINEVIQSITKTKTKKVAGFKFQDVLNRDTGELETQHMLVLGTSKEMDNREFIKIYKDQFSKFYGLSKSSYKVMEYIMSTLKYSTDKLPLFVPDIRMETKLSNATIYRSIAQLLDQQLIAKADFSGAYFINPQVFFKGNTLILFKKFTDIEKKVEPIKKVGKESQIEKQKLEGSDTTMLN